MDKRIFFRLVMVGFIKNLTLSITGMIDCAIVGRDLGADGLSAMKLAMPIFFVIAMFSMILSTGLSVVVSRDTTRGEKEKAEGSVQTVFTICVLIAIAFLLVGIFCPSAVTAFLAGTGFPSAVLMRRPTICL